METIADLFEIVGGKDIPLLTKALALVSLGSAVSFVFLAFVLLKRAILRSPDSGKTAVEIEAAEDSENAEDAIDLVAKRKRIDESRNRRYWLFDFLIAILAMDWNEAGSIWRDQTASSRVVVVLAILVMISALGFMFGGMSAPADMTASVSSLVERIAPARIEDDGVLMTTIGVEDPRSVSLVNRGGDIVRTWRAQGSVHGETEDDASLVWSDARIIDKTDVVFTWKSTGRSGVARIGQNGRIAWSVFIPLEATGVVRTNGIAHLLGLDAAGQGRLVTVSAFGGKISDIMIDVGSTVGRVAPAFVRMLAPDVSVGGALDDIVVLTGPNQAAIFNPIMGTLTGRHPLPAHQGEITYLDGRTVLSARVISDRVDSSGAKHPGVPDGGEALLLALTRSTIDGAIVAESRHLIPGDIASRLRSGSVSEGGMPLAGYARSELGVAAKTISPTPGVAPARMIAILTNGAEEIAVDVDTVSGTMSIRAHGAPVSEGKASRPILTHSAKY